MLIFRKKIIKNYMKLIYMDPYLYMLLQCRLIFSRKNSSLAGKTYYITTPIFYVNSDPHIGHLYTLVLADVIQRYIQLKDRSVILRIGTDEHGIKVERAALKSGLNPPLFCEKMSERFKYLAKLANIDHKGFTRTTDPKHCQSVRCFWKVLKDKGYIYESKHEGWYASRDETFYPSIAVKKIQNSDGTMSTISIETGAHVEWTSENNYHFRLSKFTNQLLDHYRKNPCFIIPRSEQNNLYHIIEQGLSDISISRPSSRYSWGIRVPEDESQTIYVWFDALLSYITSAGYPWSNSMLGEWPANIHLIGKDILRFHCVLWPALLLAADLPLPYQIVSHSHWTMNNIKMSKSLGNIVDPFTKIQTFGADPVRYFLIKEGRLESDKNYDLSDFIRNYNVDLRGKLGNLLLRVCSPHFDLKRALLCSKEYVDKNTLFQEFDTNINTIAEKVDDHMSKFQLHAALQSIFHFIAIINKFFQDFEPWKYCNHPDKVDPVIYRTLEAIRLSAILLKPFIPEKASEILDQLDVQPSRRSFKFCKLGLDKTYLQTQCKRNMLLFPKLSSMYLKK
ncbi:methionine-tRNA ligase [Pneumocystis murina B123]|uniref:Probable methionine--tRNA ligase, mitochondrial n=1 Tax=Pneumocystis murina (strain B123) TaxID=1069680 RepID=M7NV05_PNEMU|nr:methionine-tRNA ligase [Pneumocystis murina B123]EMR10956.1 methionine-tRNA ligase [Pneumocystis murina B123]